MPFDTRYLSVSPPHIGLQLEIERHSAQRRAKHPQGKSGGTGWESPLHKLIGHPWGLPLVLSHIAHLRSLFIGKGLLDLVLIRRQEASAHVDILVALAIVQLAHQGAIERQLDRPGGLGHGLDIVTEQDIPWRLADTGFQHIVIELVDVGGQLPLKGCPSLSDGLTLII